MKEIKATRDLYLTADRLAIAATDEEAAFLLAREGQIISPEIAAKYGIGEAKETETGDTNGAEEVKPKRKPRASANKAESAKENK